MSDFLERLAARALRTAPAVRPRFPSVYEPAPVIPAPPVGPRLERDVAAAPMRPEPRSSESKRAVFPPAVVSDDAALAPMQILHAPPSDHPAPASPTARPGGHPVSEPRAREVSSGPSASVASARSGRAASEGTEGTAEERVLAAESKVERLPDGPKQVSVDVQRPAIILAPQSAAQALESPASVPAPVSNRPRPDRSHERIEPAVPRASGVTATQDASAVPHPATVGTQPAEPSPAASGRARATRPATVEERTNVLPTRGAHPIRPAATRPSQAGVVPATVTSGRRPPGQNVTAPVAGPPPIQVTIGRVEIRAVPPPVATPREVDATKGGRVLSLEAYLQQQGGGAR